MEERQWRLPNIGELSGLLWGNLKLSDCAGYCSSHRDQLLFSEIFKDGHTACWSHSTGEGAKAWLVDFRFGWAGTLSKGAQNNVRLVRSGTLPRVKSCQRYTTSACGKYVHDMKSGLEWKMSVEVGKFTYLEAIERYRDFILV